MCVSAFKGSSTQALTDIKAEVTGRSMQRAIPGKDAARSTLSIEH